MAILSGHHLSNSSRGGKSVSIADRDNIQVALDEIKHNLNAFKILETDKGTHGIIALLAEQVNYLALVVERMHHDSL